MNAGVIEQIPMGVEQVFGDLQSRIMEDIVRRIRINGFVTSSADWQITRLRQLGESNAYIKQQIQTALKLSDKAIDDIYAEAVKAEYVQNAALYAKTGNALTSFADNAELQSLMSAVKAQTKGELINITRSMGFITQQGNQLKALDITKFYQQTLDAALGDIGTAAFDYNTVLKRTVKQMTNSGLRWIDYESGYHNRVTVAARRATMTGLNQTMSHINDKTAKDLGTDSFEITWHAGARETHQWFQGKVFTKLEMIEQCGLGTVEGLKGANCGHDYLAFVPGTSVRTYTDAQLKQMNDAENTPKSYNGKEYTTSEALQRQRQLETNMRAQRQEISLLKQGGGDPLDIQAAMSRYQGSSAEYTGLSKAMGLPQQRERVTIDGLGRVTGKSVSVPSVAKKIEVSGIDAVKTTKELEDYVTKSWNLESANLEGLDFDIVKKALSQVEKISKLNPDAKIIENLAKIDQDKTGIMAIGPAYDGNNVKGTILSINGSAFKGGNGEKLAKMYTDKTEANYWTAGATPENSIVHELAHCVDFEKTVSTFDYMFPDGRTKTQLIMAGWADKETTYARDTVYNAFMRYKKEVGPITKLDFKAQISRYAQANDCECIAEAVLNVYANGANALPQARIIVEEMGLIL